MANVGAHDPFAGLFLAEQTAFGTPIASDAAFIRVPLRNEDLKFEKRAGPVDREYGTDVTLKNQHFLGSFVQGTIEVYPRFDAQWFHWLLGYAMGDETLVSSLEWVNGVVQSAGSQLNGYKATANIPAGFTARRLLAGETAVGHYDQITGLIPTGWFLEIPGDGSRPFFGFPCLGKTKVALDSTSWAAPPADLGTVRVKPSDYDLDNRTDAHYLTGEKTSVTLNGWKFRTLRIEYQRSLELSDPYTSHPNDVIKPNKTGKNNVTVRLELDLEQIQPYVGGSEDWHPKHLFDIEGESVLDLVMESLTGITGPALPYALRMSLPRIKWRSATDPLNSPGVIQQSFEGQVLGADAIIARPTVDLAASSVLAFGADSDVRIFICCANDDSIRGTSKTFSAQLPSSN